MKSFPEYFQNLTGVWNLERKISDGSRFTGEARFSFVDTHVLRLNECGSLQLGGGGSVEATREWIWSLSGENRLEIFYAEKPPRLYHSVRLVRQDGHWKGSATHLCDPDTYEGDYGFAENRFSICQRVSGPKKDYTLESVYSA